jgi:hypothetical protein
MPPVRGTGLARPTGLFLGSIASFVGLVLTMIIALADRQTAQDALARELDIELSKLQAADHADAMLHGREVGLADSQPSRREST